MHVGANGHTQVGTSHVPVGVTNVATSMRLVEKDFQPVGESRLDERNRVALTKAVGVLRKVVGDVARLRFMVYANKAGQILLSPEVPVPAREAWLYRNPEALASVRRGIVQSGRGEGRVRCFAKYATDDAEPRKRQRSRK